MSVEEFALPDLGEGLTESDLVAWRVTVGDAVELNQIIAEVETAKALVEVPSPYAGVVRELHAEPGETLEVGAPLMSFEVDGDGADDEALVAEAVGVGAARAEASGRPVVGHENGRPIVRSGSTATVTDAVDVPVAGADVADGDDVARDDGPDGDADRHAGPAEEERHEVLVGRGPKARSAKRPQRKPRTGRLTEPVAWVRPHGVGRGASEPEQGDRGDGTRDEGETRELATGVRRRTAEAMVRSAAVPQVTEFLTVDVTRSIRLLKRLAETKEFRDRRLTVLTLAAKALSLGLAQTPEANSRWDDATGEIVTPAGVNLGIAVATSRGLVVPNIRDASTLRMPELADALTSLAERARAGRATPAELTGGTITITNVGVFGVDAGTPLLNPGETAILALGAVNRRPWEHNGAVRLRQVMTLSLTFDHRVIDGEQGSRLLRDVGRILADPASTLALA
ncbi:dihydrolipoamide acetyltransferase family protein [Humibacter ginsenosidimutans]|uniref:Dihydrolipoamide acetyltransferase component of pyruvate dehydrogenase complex n=1 Tax=Humibacter ginsenosidimutans TaxID=2599293 RepID=A0A5B8M0D0_9MICO|nr:dihydrolipoamide acetyltransferase family protein [Humibacter ginsenosidimutans]QDZ13491.1 2-oxo acid dehydrogenase subunit E2 [Humibacter ginsenosidimutans]